jgi:hypothetical protein
MSNLETSIARLDAKIDAIANDLDNQWAEKQTKGVQGFVKFAVITSCGLLIYHHAGVPLMQSIAANAPQGNPLSTPWDATGDAISGYPGKEIVKASRYWVGKNYKPGVSAMCASFVRYVFGQMSLEVPITQYPLDNKPVHNNGLMANSFWGADVGMIIEDPDRWQPGMLVLFYNTYGQWVNSNPPVVTHVGILTTRNSDGEWMMVDRSTRSAPIRERPISTFKNVAGAIRPNVRRIAK